MTTSSSASSDVAPMTSSFVMTSNLSWASAVWLGSGKQLLRKDFLKAARLFGLTFLLKSFHGCSFLSRL